jgi:hypothetical protein
VSFTVFRRTLEDWSSCMPPHPVPEAQHGVAHFQQDLEFFRKTNRLLLDEFGLQYNGSWHSHHFLSVKSLSGRDIQSTWSLAARNNYVRLCQFLLTFEQKSNSRSCIRSVRSFSNSPFNRAEGHLPSGRSFAAKKHPPSERVFVSSSNVARFIAIHSFLYSDAKAAVNRFRARLECFLVKAR